MKKSEILYEPLPIGRIGVRRDTEEVIVAKDFSCFAHMLEEYISFGAVDIVMPQSAPETTVFDQMPPILRKRIRVVNDENETEAVRRLLFKLRKEFDVKEANDNEGFLYPKGMPPELISSIGQIHTDVKKIALGFNHSIQINIDPIETTSLLIELRKKSNDQQTRVVLAQLEALLKTYDDINFDAPTPPTSTTPKELLSVFDRLINDSSYLEYSDSISRLALLSSRNEALIELREMERGIREKAFVSTGWNYISKVLKVWTGAPIPDSSAISSVIYNRSLPPLVDLKEARKKAVEMWKSSDLKNTPLRRDGTPITEENIHWLPPLGSMVVGSPGCGPFAFGTVGELKQALEESISQIDGGSDKEA